MLGFFLWLPTSLNWLELFGSSMESPTRKEELKVGEYIVVQICDPFLVLWSRIKSVINRASRIYLGGIMNPKLPSRSIKMAHDNSISSEYSIVVGSEISFSLASSPRALTGIKSEENNRNSRVPSATHKAFTYKTMGSAVAITFLTRNREDFQ